MARALALLSAPVVSPSTVVLSGTPAVATVEFMSVRPDPTDQHQPLQGWDTSLVWFANAAGGYPDAPRDQLAELLFGEDGLNLNIARYNIGGGDAPDVPRRTSDVSTHDQVWRLERKSTGHGNDV